MPKVEFDFSPTREVQDPFYLGFVASRPPNRLRSERASYALGAGHAPGVADRPLHLDLAVREPRRRPRGVTLIRGGAMTLLLLAAAAVALFLAPPSILRERLAAITTSAQPAVGTPARAAPEIAAATAQAEPLQPHGASGAAQPRAIAVPASPAAPSAGLGSPQASIAPSEVRSEAPDTVSKRHWSRTPALKTVSAPAKPARAHPAPKRGLDLDALEKSLR